MSLPAYGSYRDTPVDWIGTVPSHWDVKSLKRGLRLITGRTDRRSWAVGLENIESWTGRLVETDADFEGEGVGFESGDVLYGKLRPYLAKVHVADRPGEAVGDFHVLRAQTGVLPQFFGYQLRTHEVVSQLNGSTFGARMPRVGWEFMGGLPLAFPPVAEQAAIADFLDRETGKIDALAEAQRRLIELLKEKRQAVISHAVTKGLDHTVPMKDSGVEWLGEVPAHWGVSRLKFVARVQTGVAKGKDWEKREVVAVPYLRVANVQAGYIDVTDVSMIELPESEIARYLLRPGDVLMNEGGDFDKLGRGAVWDGAIDPCVHQNHVFAVRPHSVSPEWLNLITGADYAQFFFMGRSKQSTNLASISSSNLMELPVLVPPRGEQERIENQVAAACESIDELVGQNEAAIALLHERRAALISAAVTGKIDVRGLSFRETEAA